MVKTSAGNEAVVHETFHSIYRRLTKQFRNDGMDNPELEARFLLMGLLGLSLETITMSADRIVEPEDIYRIEQAAAAREAGAPLAHILGSADFYGRTFVVSRATLIPRPDSELLIDLARGELADVERPRILDLGSGTGALAITLALEFAGSDVTALEMSVGAMAVLQRNIEELGAVNVTPVLGDMRTQQFAQPFDLIVTNPPYIESAVIPTLQKEVLQEPRMALDGGPDGLYYYHLIAKRFWSALTPGGLVIAELPYDKASEAAGIFMQAGFTNVHVHKDLAKNDRAIVARRGL